jgi:hypothetical protein
MPIFFLLQLHYFYFIWVSEWLLFNAKWIIIQLYMGLTQPGLEPTIYRTRGEHVIEVMEISLRSYKK